MNEETSKSLWEMELKHELIFVQENFEARGFFFSTLNNFHEYFEDPWYSFKLCMVSKCAKDVSYFKSRLSQMLNL